MQKNKNTSSLISFNNTYIDLPESFYQRIDPTPVTAPNLKFFNEPLAKELNITIKNSDTAEVASIFSGNTLLPGAAPLAMAYAGHQFGNFVPQLGDGRAILLGEVTDIYGAQRDLHLKGAGQTRFSRQGDGRATLGPVIREYIISEAMHALGIPTTRSLAVVTTGEFVQRETLQPGAILTRVAHSHLRVGTFEFFRARNDIASLKTLAEYAMRRLYPAALHADNPILELLKSILKSQAFLVAKWMQVGFIHGVMNTDNTSTSGETIDYGPCAFMDDYDPATVFSSIDYQGRYAYMNQPTILQWNMQILCECFLPLLDSNPQTALAYAQEALSSFSTLFNHYWVEGMTAKLGLGKAEPRDITLIQNLFSLMKKYQADFTLSFRLLATAVEEKNEIRDLKNLFHKSEEFDAWLAQWRERLTQENREPAHISQEMKKVNPLYIPRNHLVEEAISAAIHYNDFSKTEQLLKVLSTPYTEQEAYIEERYPQKIKNKAYKTFCGT